MNPFTYAAIAAGPLGGPALYGGGKALGMDGSGQPVRTYAPNADNYAFGGSSAARDDWRRFFNQQTDQAAAERAGVVGQQQQARGEQADLVQAYRDVESGKAPSLARMQLAEGQQAAAQRGAALAASARGGGGNILQAQRYAQEQAALGAAQTSADQAKLRTVEIAQARDARGQLASGMRGQDLQAQQMADQRYRDALGSRVGLEQTNLASMQAYDAAQRGEYDRANDLVIQQQTANRDRAAKIYDSTLTTGGKVGMGALGMGGGK